MNVSRQVNHPLQRPTGRIPIRLNEAILPTAANVDISFQIAQAAAERARLLS